MIDYIKNLNSIIKEGIADDLAKLLGVEKEEADNLIAGLKFSEYLELSNAVDIEDKEAAMDILDFVSPVQEEEQMRLDLEDRIDMLNEPCRECRKGRYIETSIHDDWDGVLHCNKCNDRTKRHLRVFSNDVIQEDDDTIDCPACSNGYSSSGKDVWGDTCVRCGGKGILTADGDYVEESAANEDNKLLDKPTPTLGELSKKHKVPLADLGVQLVKGIKAELEHTSDRKVAKEIALDHLNEKPDYYDRLEGVEEEGGCGGGTGAGGIGVGGGAAAVGGEAAGVGTGKSPKKKKKSGWNFGGSIYEGALKRQMEDDAYGMGKSRFVKIYGEEHGDFWDYINGISTNASRLIGDERYANNAPEWRTKKGVEEADNPYTPITPPSEQMPSSTVAQDGDEEGNIGRKEVADLRTGDDIEVIDIDGEPVAVTVKNPRGPGDTLVVQTDKGEEHMVKKQAVSGTPKMEGLKQMYEAAMSDAKFDVVLSSDDMESKAAEGVSMKDALRAAEQQLQMFHDIAIQGDGDPDSIHVQRTTYRPIVNGTPMRLPEWMIHDEVTKDISYLVIKPAEAIEEKGRWTRIKNKDGKLGQRIKRAERIEKKARLDKVDEVTIAQYDAWANDDIDADAEALINKAIERCGDDCSAENVIRKIKTGWSGLNPATVNRAIEFIKHDSTIEEAIPKSSSYALVGKDDNIIVKKGNAKAMRKLRKADLQNKYYVGVTHSKQVGDKFKDAVEEGRGRIDHLRIIKMISSELDADMDEREILMLIDYAFDDLEIEFDASIANKVLMDLGRKPIAEAADKVKPINKMGYAPKAGSWKRRMHKAQPPENHEKTRKRYKKQMQEEENLEETKTTTWLGIPNVKIAPPTKRHRPAIWEAMLGTVNAMSDDMVTKMFDYDHDGAKQYANIDNKTDFRLHRYVPKYRRQWDKSSYPTNPRNNQWVLWVEREAAPVSQPVEEGYGEQTYAEMVEYWKNSLSQSIVRKGLFTQMYDAAGQNIDTLNAAISDKAHSIASRYHGSGDGIGSSDQNHFIDSIANSLGIEDIFGWDKPREPAKFNPIAKDADMERDKAVRGMKANAAIRGQDGINEARNANNTEHAGAKKGKGGYYGRKKDAKSDSNKKRRENDKKAVTEAAKIGCTECDEVSTEAAWKKNDGSCPKCNSSTQGVAEELTRLRELAGIRVDEVKAGTFNSPMIGQRVKIVSQEDAFGNNHYGEEGVITRASREHTFSQMVPFIIEYGVQLDSGEKITIRRESIRKVKQVSEDAIDQDYSYEIWRTEPMSNKWTHNKGDTYHSLDRAKDIRSTMLKGATAGTKVKIKRVPRKTLAGPKGKLPETASCGGTGAGAVAVGPVAVGGMVSRNPGIYGSTEKPKRKKRSTKEEASDGIGRTKK